MHHEPFTMIQFALLQIRFPTEQKHSIVLLKLIHVVSTVLQSIVPNVHCQLSRQPCWKLEANTQGRILWGPQNHPHVHIEGGWALVEVTMGQNARPQPTISNKITGNMLGIQSFLHLFVVGCVVVGLLTTIRSYLKGGWMGPNQSSSSSLVIESGTDPYCHSSGKGQEEAQVDKTLGARVSNPRGKNQCSGMYPLSPAEPKIVPFYLRPCVKTDLSLAPLQCEMPIYDSLKL